MKVVGSLTCARCHIEYRDMATDNTVDHTGWICDSCVTEQQMLPAADAGTNSAVADVDERTNYLVRFLEYAIDIKGRIGGNYDGGAEVVWGDDSYEKIAFDFLEYDAEIIRNNQPRQTEIVKAGLPGKF